MQIKILYLILRYKAICFVLLNYYRLLSTECVTGLANSEFALGVHDVLFLSVTREVGAISGGVMNGTGLHIPVKPFLVGV